MAERESINILDVRVGRTTRQQAITKVEKLLEANQSAQIATVNPEFIVIAQGKPKFRKVLNQSQLSLADGIGIRAAAKFLALDRSIYPIIRFFQTLLQGIFLIAPAITFYPSYLNILPETVTGVDLSYSIAELCAKKRYSIFLLGAAEGVAEKTAKQLKKLYPGLKVAGCYAGSPRRGEEDKIINMINKSQPRILLVAYGAPKQDLWIARNLGRIEQPLIAMGVGGTFDFISGKIKRAPNWIRKLNLEWLYRLTKEPGRRIKRIYLAAIVFPYLVWKKKLGLE